MNQNRSKKGRKKRALERVDIERGRGQMSTEQAAFLLPALLPAGLPRLHFWLCTAIQNWWFPSD